MANCFLVVNQATRWGMDPFGVAQCLSIVKGKFCYEGKLVAAVLDAKLGVSLKYTYNDKAGDALAVVVSGVVDGEEKTIEGSVGAWKTTGPNSPWTSQQNHRRQLAYRGAREWARIHKPALMLGAYTDDEIDDLQEVARSNRARDISPPPPPPMEIAAEPSPESAPASSSQQVADAAGASASIPQPDDAPAAPSDDAIDPEAELASLDEKLGFAANSDDVEAWYAETDIEAVLADFTGFVERAREIRDRHVARTARQSDAARAAPASDEAGDDAPPPPADESASASEPFDLNGWQSCETQEEYVQFAERLIDHARGADNYSLVEDFWKASQPVRAKVVPVNERNKLNDRLSARWNKA
ncbi:MAG: hypothetical protein J0I42_14815 [Bosea sp.]|uniref:hypothetical protein n=1 Tax=Bosea sp. (in: a-proteobacteria) TaxID=1871050 RepID=UPI001ACD557F|nr:hypothetical protein [Bosea sp. (in: a-proteobacteria)]MBN9453217.1 hypothetical protein [Bosea sp. (in: a-proteobacteria)]